MFSEAEGLLTELERTGAPIWDNIYQVRMSYRDSLNTESVKQFGLASSGNEYFDQQMMNDQVTVMINIDKIAEYFRRGVIVSVCRWADLESMYNIINKYLATWHNLFERAVNVCDAPTEDLLLLDQLATVLFEQSRRFNGVRLPERTLFTNQLGATASSRTSLFRNIEEDTLDVAQQAETHSSYARSFKRMVFNADPSSVPEEAAPRSSRWK